MAALEKLGKWPLHFPAYVTVPCSVKYSIMWVKNYAYLVPNNLINKLTKSSFNQYLKNLLKVNDMYTVHRTYSKHKINCLKMLHLLAWGNFEVDKSWLLIWQFGRSLRWKRGKGERFISLWRFFGTKISIHAPVTNLHNIKYNLREHITDGCIFLYSFLC